jgi:2'-5' RNA ligase
MQNPRFALVAYITSPVGEFVESLRRELHPDLPHLAAHLTILPPRPLHGTESSALHTLERLCEQVEPFEINLGKVETFIPDTPTIYIGVDHTATRMRELHDQLNTQSLASREEWPYIPHLTIAKMASEPHARDAFKVARERWAHYRGSRQVLLERLTFVREREQDCWEDVAQVHLGRQLVSH